jgi:hypothetical protein
MKIWEAQKTMQDAEQLLGEMMHMIEEQRYIIERYRLMWGNDMYSQPIEELNDEIDFSLCIQKDECTLVRTENIIPKFKNIKTKYHAII